MRRLWLRKCSNTSNLYQHAAGQPSHRRAAARPRRPSRTRAANPSQLQPRHRPCRSARTAAQLASRERGQKRLNQKHLARKMWAGVRVASRLLAWLIRARARRTGFSGPADNGDSEARSLALDGFVERSASLSG